jgi:hypothetical protein
VCDGRARWLGAVPTASQPRLPSAAPERTGRSATCRGTDSRRRAVSGCSPSQLEASAAATSVAAATVAAKLSIRCSSGPLCSLLDTSSGISGGCEAAVAALRWCAAIEWNTELSGFRHRQRPASTDPGVCGRCPQSSCADPGGHGVHAFAGSVRVQHERAAGECAAVSAKRLSFVSGGRPQFCGARELWLALTLPALDSRCAQRHSDRRVLRAVSHCWAPCAYWHACGSHGGSGERPAGARHLCRHAAAVAQATGGRRQLGAVTLR